MHDAGPGCTGKGGKPSLRAMGAWEAYPLAGPRSYRPSNAVAAIGHSLIGPGARLGPMVTFGCLSCAMEPPGGPPGPQPQGGLPTDGSMLMTDCLVHSGCSGGALVLMDEVRASSASLPAGPCSWSVRDTVTPGLVDTDCMTCCMISLLVARAREAKPPVERMMTCCSGLCQRRNCGDNRCVVCRRWAGRCHLGGMCRCWG